MNEGWIFGYGSLIVRPGFSFVERRVARVHGWARRFWQASPDHRGTPEAPGRVVTLVPTPGQVCTGVVVRMHPDEAADVFARLDHRERAGYERVVLEAETSSGPVSAWTWIAAAGNANFVGPSPLSDIAAVIARASGPSGSNVDYLAELHAALREIEGLDAHVEHLWTTVRALLDAASSAQ